MKPCFKKKHVSAAWLGHYQFKASNGWLQNFNKHHNIKRFTISGETACVSKQTFEGWHEKLYNQVNHVNT